MKRLIAGLIILTCSMGVCFAYSTTDTIFDTNTYTDTDKSYYTDEVCEICGKSLRKKHEGSSNSLDCMSSSCFITIGSVIETPNYLQSRKICLCDWCYKKYREEFKKSTEQLLEAMQRVHKKDRERHKKQRADKKKKDDRIKIEQSIKELTELLKKLK